MIFFLIILCAAMNFESRNENINLLNSDIKYIFDFIIFFFHGNITFFSAFGRFSPNKGTKNHICSVMHK